MPTDTKLGSKYQGDFHIKISKNRTCRKSKMAAKAAILKIYFELMNEKAKWLET